MNASPRDRSARGEPFARPNDTAFPAVLRDSEADLIEARREIAAMDPAKAGFPDGAVGLALSGGGIRSATFNLGILQALARARLLRMVDYLSTVSGGGYIGSFLGRYYTRFINRPRGATDVIETRLSDPDAPEIRWLRLHGNYLAPGGSGDTFFNAGIFLRNFLTLQMVVGFFLLSCYGCANAVRFGVHSLARQPGRRDSSPTSRSLALASVTDRFSHQYGIPGCAGAFLESMDRTAGGRVVVGDYSPWPGILAGGLERSE